MLLYDAADAVDSTDATLMPLATLDVEPPFSVSAAGARCRRYFFTTSIAPGNTMMIRPTPAPASMVMSTPDELDCDSPLALVSFTSDDDAVVGDVRASVTSAMRAVVVGVGVSDCGSL